jgi:uncharacterized protein YcbX
LTITRLYHYPVKGLSPQPLERVELVPGHGFPFDRMVGIARADSGFDPDHPRPLPKQRFFMLARDARLAALRTRLDPATRRLTIHADGRLVLDCDLASAEGQAASVDYFVQLFGLTPENRPLLAYAAPHRFTDVSVTSAQMMNAISLINVASCRQLGERVGSEVDPLRFRANVYFDGWPPFSELERVGEEFRIGEARLRILKRTQRCAATEVNPATAQRDLRVPQLLMEHYGHADMGVYAEVLEPGTIAPGLAIALDPR